MPSPKLPCQEIYPWLKANLGKRCLAPLTGTDARCLLAAVQILDVYRHSRSPSALMAFSAMAGMMQRSTQELAYHAIGMMMEWESRMEVWTKAGLAPFDRVRLCAYEPGGASR